MQMNAYVAGVGMTRFGKHLEITLKGLAGEAIREALSDAGISGSDLEVAYMGNAAGGVVQGQEMISGQVALRELGIGKIPVINVENACATSSTAFNQACAMVTAGMYDVALVCGFEKLFHEDKARSFAAFDGAVDTENVEGVMGVMGALNTLAAKAGEEVDSVNAGKTRSVFMDIYSLMSIAHMKEYGTTQEQIAGVTAKNSFHGSLNPRAQFQTAMTVEEVLASREIVYPLTLPMCSPIGDGAAAVVVVSERKAKELGLSKPVKVLSSALVSGYDQQAGDLSVGAYAANLAYEAAGVGPGDLSLIELHDASATSEIIAYEYLAICEKGQGGLSMSERNPQILANLIRNWCDQAPDREILTFVAIDTNGEFQDEKRSYQQLWDNGQRLAAWLRDQGMQKGDTFALVMQNHPEFVDFMVASSILGTVFVPIDSRTRGDKLKYMLDFADCKGAVVGDNALAEVETVWRGRKQWIATLGNGDEHHTGISSLLEGPVPEPEMAVRSTDPDAPMQLLYTSGTTGDPKAILSTNSRYAVSATLPQVFGLDENDCLYTGLSLTHANAQVVTLGITLHTGIPAVISVKFTKSRLWDITRQYGCTFFNLLGGMTTAIYAEPVRDDDADNPVRTILSAGMPSAIWDDFAQRFGVNLFEFYGAAEGGLTFNPTGTGPVGSCGKAPPSMQLTILDEDGNPVAAGVAGEICFREADGSCPSLTYFKNPEATAKKIAGGWLHMGDIGHLDEDGWLFFHYRMGGGIRKNGDFINTAFVEKALSESPAVSDVYVYGITVSEGLAPGEKDVIAAVVPTDPARFEVETLLAHCREKLDRNSVPGFIQVLDEIPKTASEKPQERFLVEAFEANSGDVYHANS